MTRSIGQLLKQIHTIDGQWPGLENQMRLQQDLVSALSCWLPSIQQNLAALVYVIRLERGTLTLAIHNSTLAAKLRQMSPRMVSELATRGWKVSAIQLRTQPKFFPEKTNRYKNKTLSTKGLSAFSELKNNLEHPGLAAAVGRLLKHHQTSKPKD